MCTAVDDLGWHPVTAPVTVTSCMQTITLPLTEPSCIYPRQGNSLELQNIFAFAAEMASLQPQSEGCLHLLHSADILLYTLGRSAIPSVLIYHTVPELQPNSIANTVWESKPKMENKVKSVYLSGKLVHVTWLSHLGKGGKPIKLCLDPKSALPLNQMAPWLWYITFAFLSSSLSLTLVIYIFESYSNCGFIPTPTFFRVKASNHPKHWILLLPLKEGHWKHAVIFPKTFLS